MQMGLHADAHHKVNTPDDPVPHASPAASPTVSPGNVLGALGHADVRLGAVGLDTPQVAPAVPALGNGPLLLRVLESEPARIATCHNLASRRGKVERTETHYRIGALLQPMCAL